MHIIDLSKLEKVATAVAIRHFFSGITGENEDPVVEEITPWLERFYEFPVEYANGEVMLWSVFRNKDPQDVREYINNLRESIITEMSTIISKFS